MKSQPYAYAVTQIAADLRGVQVASIHTTEDEVEAARSVLGEYWAGTDLLYSEDQVRKAIEEETGDLTDALLTEHQVATDLAQQVAHWIQRHDDIKAQALMHLARIEEYAAQIRALRQAIDTYGHSPYCERGCALSINKNTTVKCTCYMREVME